MSKKKKKKFSALWDSLAYSNIAVLARPTAQVPRWAGNVSGGPRSIPGRFWRTGVPSFRRCSAEPSHSGSVKYLDVVRPLHRPLQYRVRGWGRLKNKTKNWRLLHRAFPFALDLLSVIAVRHPFARFVHTINVRN